MRIGSFSHMTYKDFLTSKIEIAKDSGFEISDSEINPALKPHQRDAGGSSTGTATRGIWFWIRLVG